MVGVARKSALLSESPVDFICGSLPAKLYPGKLKDGYSRCISFTAGGGSFLTPCEFERRAGRSSAKNWKKTIRYAGKPIGSFLLCSVSENGKKQFLFVTSSPPTSRGQVSRMSLASNSASFSAVSASDPNVTTSAACPDLVVTPVSPELAVTTSAIPIPVVATIANVEPVVSTSASLDHVMVPSVNLEPAVTVTTSPDLVTIAASTGLLVTTLAGSDPVVSISAGPDVLPSSVNKSSVITSPSPVGMSSVHTSLSPVTKSSVGTSPSLVTKSSVNSSPSPVSKSSVNTSPSPVTRSSVDISLSPVDKSSVNTSPSPVSKFSVNTSPPPVSKSSINTLPPSVSKSSVNTSPSPVCSDPVLDVCPLCNKHFSSCSHLWQHINSVHISRSTFPPAAFFDSCNRLICSQPSCRWASHHRYRNSGCRRLLSTGKHCGAALAHASTVSNILTSHPSIPCTSTPPVIDEPSLFSDDPLQVGLNSVACGSFQGPSAMEPEVRTSVTL